MSEEVALALSDAAELARLRGWARLWRAIAMEMRQRWRHQSKRRAHWQTRYREAIQARDQALAELARLRAAQQAKADGHGKPWRNEA